MSLSADFEPALALSLYRSMLLIRRFEETVLAEFKRGIFSGTTHTYLGQEANAVGVLSQIQPGDVVVSNHRCHGHFLAYGGDPYALFAELMGKRAGVCGGRGGSQHLHWRNFYSNGVLGGTVPIAAGMALAEKRKKSGAGVVVFLGDGALGEGVVYESLNLAAIWNAPILFVVENNHMAQTTPITHALAGSVAGRFEAFGIPCIELDTSHVMEVVPAASQLLDDVRQNQTPRALILNTERLGPHSKGDDTRSAEELERLWQTRDPLAIQAGMVELEARRGVEQEVEEMVKDAFTRAMKEKE